MGDKEIVELDMILNAVEAALDGEEVSDFAESYPVVRKAIDVYEKAHTVLSVEYKRCPKCQEKYGEVEPCIGNT